MKKLIWLLGIACASENASDGGEAESEAESESEGEGCTAGDTRCSDNAHFICSSEGAWGKKTPCGEDVCDSTLGCVDCIPGTVGCDGLQVLDCNVDGTWKPGEVCDLAKGQLCFSGVCQDACDVAAASSSYLGCEYWPTITVNPVKTSVFEFVVAIGNPYDVGVEITVHRGDTLVEELTIGPGLIGIIVLPWIDELVQNPEIAGYAEPKSVFVADGAYRVRSSLPVSAYQFNPLEFADGYYRSYSNDASLLLPTSRLDDLYLVVSRPSQSLGFTYSGIYAVVATEDDTDVTITSSAYTEEGFGGNPAAMGPGEEATYTLDQGDVLQVLSAREYTAVECDSGFCVGGSSYDPTGTRIETTHPVAVFSGHQCALIPYNQWACDHVEEQLFPLETWGTSALAVSTKPQHIGEPNVWKIVSGSDANEITFAPAVHSGVTLDAGEFVEFEYGGAFQVDASGRIAVAQFMVGGDYYGTETSDGDPAMGLVIPTEQFRTSYDFLTPSTFTHSYVNVIANLTDPPQLDGEDLPKLTAIGDTDYGWARVEVDSGVHRLEGPVTGFGVTVYGVGEASSYLFPGGLDLEVLPIE